MQSDVEVWQVHPDSWVQSAPATVFDSGEDYDSKPRDAFATVSWTSFQLVLQRVPFSHMLAC